MGFILFRYCCLYLAFSAVTTAGYLLILIQAKLTRNS